MEIKENRFTLAEGATHATNFAERRLGFHPNNVDLRRVKQKQVTVKNSLYQRERGWGEGSTFNSATTKQLQEPNNVTNKKVAFTLAEVLITLGIIGVVAALTLPALIQNYQKKVYVNKLKKVSSTIEQGFGLMFADEGVDKFSDIPIFQSTENGPVGTYDEEFCKYLKKYFKFADVSEGATDKKPYVIKYIGSNDGDDLSSDTYLKFSDGTWIEFTYFPDEQSMNAQFDINGSQNPNEYGRDYFYININDNGKIEIKKNPYCNVGSGDDCYSKIVQDGWEMKY